MPPTPSWGFGPFRLDLGSGSLWRGEQLIRLPPKPLAVLAYLVAHAGQVVTKETLLAAVWPEVVVTEGVLKTCLGQIRHVLGETAKAPRYIATAHRRGYRFIAPVTVTDESITEEEAHATSPAEEQPPRPRSVPHPPELMVGREAELAQLQRWWTRAMQGERQVVFVTGEAGIGKTALVDAFVSGVAGMEFSAAAVAAGVDRAVEDVEAQYDALARRGQVVSRRGTEAWVDGTVAGRYGFLHDLHREFVYDRVPVSRRVRWHRTIGRRLELGYGPQAREMAAKLAEHFVRGRDPERAVQYLYYAGEQAVQRSAHLEAIGHLTTGLKLLITLPETPERAHQELLLQTTLGAALMATKGYAAPEVEHAYARARELCQQVGETPELFRVLLGLHMFYRQRAELQTSYEVGKQLLTLAESVQTPEFLLVAHQALGTTWYFLGGVAHARTHLEQGMALSASRPHRPYAFLYGQDPGVICLSTLARALWALGYPDQALQKSQEALTLARQLVHPFSLAFALYFGAVVAQYRREWRGVQRLAEALMALSVEHGFTQRLAQGRIMLGWTLVERGQVAEGIAQIGQSVAAYGATGADLGRSSYLALLAEAYGKAGQVEEGLTVLADALTAVQEHQIRFNETELYRLQGELLLRQVEGKRSALARPATEAEACLQQALEVARRQQTKSLELRAAMSLSRLWQRQGKRAEAHQLLEEVYSWFTEGFDTVDLREAKALLEELEG